MEELDLKSYNKYINFVDEFYNIIKNKIYDNIIFVCIGTDRITGDCFGPIVGSILLNKKIKYKIPNVQILGCLEENVNFSKIEEKVIPQILKYEKPLVISIDAALSEQCNIGKIYIKNEGMELGKSLNKHMELFGDISIKAVVGKNMKSNKENFTILQNISLNEVIRLSNLVANGIIEVMNKKNKCGKNVYI